jgi:hypothetical protein
VQDNQQHLELDQEEKIRGSAFVEAPMQVGKAGAFNSAEATLMVGQTDNEDCKVQIDLFM